MPILVYFYLSNLLNAGQSIPTLLYLYLSTRSEYFYFYSSTRSEYFCLYSSTRSEYFHFWYFKYILMPILVYFYLSNLLNAGQSIPTLLYLYFYLSTISEYFFHLWPLKENIPIISNHCDHVAVTWGSTSQI